MGLGQRNRIDGGLKKGDEGVAGLEGAEDETGRNSEREGEKGTETGEGAKGWEETVVSPHQEESVSRQGVRDTSHGHLEVEAEHEP